jgi:WD40 repeat protein
VAVASQPGLFSDHIVRVMSDYPMNKSLAPESATTAVDMDGVEALAHELVASDSTMDHYTENKEELPPCDSYLVTVHSTVAPFGTWRNSYKRVAQAENVVRVWCGRTYAPVCIINPPDKVFEVCFSPDNSQLVTCGPPDKGSVSIWLIPASPTTLKGTPVQTEPEASIPVPGVSTAVFNNTGLQLATRSLNGRLSLWDMASRTIIWVKTESFTHRSPIYFSVCGDLIITAVGSNDSLKFWDSTNGAVVRSISHSHAHPIHDFAVSPLADVVATSSNGWTIRIWDIATGLQTMELYGQGPNASIHISRDGSKLLSGCSNGHCLVWNVLTGELLSVQEAAGKILSLSFNVEDESKFTYSVENNVHTASAEPGFNMSFCKEKHAPLTKEPLLNVGRLRYSNPSMILM